MLLNAICMLLLVFTPLWGSVDINSTVPIDSISYEYSDKAGNPEELIINVKLRDSVGGEASCARQDFLSSLMVLDEMNNPVEGGTAIVDNNPDRTSLLVTYRIQIGTPSRGLFRLDKDWKKVNFRINYRCGSMSPEVKSTVYSITRSLLRPQTVKLEIMDPQWYNQKDTIYVPLQANDDIRVHLTMKQSGAVIAQTDALISGKTTVKLSVDPMSGYEIVRGSTCIIEASSLRNGTNLDYSSKPFSPTPLPLYKFSSESGLKDLSINTATKEYIFTVSTTTPGSLDLYFEGSQVQTQKIPSIYIEGTHKFSLSTEFLKTLADKQYLVSFNGTSETGVDFSDKDKKYTLTKNTQVALVDATGFSITSSTDPLNSKRLFRVDYTLSRDVETTVKIGKDGPYLDGTKNTDIASKPSSYPYFVNFDLDAAGNVNAFLSRSVDPNKITGVVEVQINLKNPEGGQQERLSLYKISVLNNGAVKTKLEQAAMAMDNHATPKVITDLIKTALNITTTLTDDKLAPEQRDAIESTQKGLKDKDNRRKFISAISTAGRITAGIFGIPIL